jgi:chemotaxis protein CheD
MTTCMAVESVDNKSVGMGQVLLATAPGHLNAVLGSCVGVALYHRRLKLGALAHVVLPDSAGRPASIGKFADTAVPYMIQQLEAKGAAKNQLLARIAGGACMFGTGGPLQIGDANIEAVTKALDAVGIRIQAQDVGGTKGRRVTLDCANGQFVVQIVGESPRTL